jgi:hypothetical protein
MSSCIWVSTTPGRIARLVISGSSSARDWVIEFTAALDAEYADHAGYAFIAAPEDTNIMEPRDERRWGIASLICYKPGYLVGFTRDMFEKTLTLKHSFHASDVEFSNFATGSRVPAFNTIESRRPNIFKVSEIADFAVPSRVISHWIKWSNDDGRADSSTDLFRDNTMTLAAYVEIRAFTIPRPN